MDRLRRRRLVAFVVMGAGLIAAAAYYWTERPYCADTGPGLRGEVKREADGRLLYFNGQCWTRKPMPPRDTPF